MLSASVQLQRAYVAVGRRHRARSRLRHNVWSALRRSRWYRSTAAPIAHGAEANLDLRADNLAHRVAALAACLQGYRCELLA